jgi:hypothetical protein
MPRQTVFTRTLSGAYSLASALVRLMPAARVTEVGSERAAGALPPTVVTFTMAPPPRAFIIGITSRQKRTAAISLRSRSICQVASSTASKAAAAEVPALLTRMSTPPKRPTAAFTNASMSGIRVTSAGCARISAPVAFSMAPAAARSTSGRRAHMATFAPHPASFSAVARPSPSLAPVMIATLPLSPSSMESMAGNDTTAGNALFRASCTVAGHGHPTGRRRA